MIKEKLDNKTFPCPMGSTTNDHMAKLFHRNVIICLGEPKMYLYQDCTNGHWYMWAYVNPFSKGE